MTLRIAMWSGPRNISTALMRAWGNRPDTAVCDEPLYAYYLQRTGVAHPGAAEVIAAHECDPARVAAWLTGPVPGGRSVFYQKHMAHHLLPEIERGWLGRLRHAFLIRDPKAMLISLSKKIARPELSDTGIPQQVELFRREADRAGRAPPVIDARDVLRDPERVLRSLCDGLGAPFDRQMLSWRPGPRDTDGVWGKYWYREVYASTGFRPHTARDEPLPADLEAVHERCLAGYRELAAHRLHPNAGPAGP